MMTNNQIAEALVSIRPGAQWKSNGDGYSGIIWLDTEQTIPTESELRAAITAVEAERLATEYKRLRAASYPPIGDQLDALFHAGVFPAEMAVLLQAVKDQYPKP